MQIKIFMESPAGDVKEVVVTDPNKDLVPLMVAGWHTGKTPGTGRPRTGHTGTARAGGRGKVKWQI